MIEFEEYKSKLNDLKPKLEELRAAFVPQSLLDELERLHAIDVYKRQAGGGQQRAVDDHG